MVEGGMCLVFSQRGRCGLEGACVFMEPRSGSGMRREGVRRASVFSVPVHSSREGN